MKTAIIITTDPKSGTEEANGRLFNALALAQESQRLGDEVEVTFIGTGTRWPAELSKLEHPFNALYDSVRGTIKGASCACATVFGATEGLKACDLSLVQDHAVPGTPGLASIRRYLAEGWTTLVF
ncbi:hypothetical protein BH09VER1_BH09VER1_05390 [soil metagenome]